MSLHKVIKLIFIIPFLLMGISNCLAQNLVPNPSFEDTSSLGCPTVIGLAGDVEHCKYWYQIYGTSPDYYKGCTTGNPTSVPNNMSGYQLAHSGNAYCGLIPNTFITNGINVFLDWNEYIGVKIKKPLTIGQVYQFQMFLNLSDKSRETTDAISVLFTKSKISNLNSYDYISGRVPQLKNDSGNFIVNRVNWAPYTKYFIADSMYKFLTIGDFKNHLNTRKLDTKKPSGWIPASSDCPYFLIDDVSLIPIHYICLGDSVTLNSHQDTTYKWIKKSTPNIIISTDSVIMVSPTNNTIYYNYNGNDTSKFIVRVLSNGNLNLGNDTNLCPGEKLILNPLIPNSSYLWQDGSTGSQYTVTQPGTYWVQVTSTCGVFSDTIKVTYNTIPVNLGNDTIICPNGFGYTLNPNIPNASYLWSNYSTNPTYTAYSTGKYWVQVTDSVGCGSDTILVTVRKPPSNHFLRNDTTICQGDTLAITAHAHSSSFQWSTGSTDSVIYATQAGNYWVKATNSCFTEMDSVNVTVKPTPYFNLGNDTTLCNGSSLILKVNAGSSMWWQNFANLDIRTFLVTKPGKYYATTYLNGCFYTDTIQVKYADCNVQLNIPNVFTPNGDGINDSFRVKLKDIKKGSLTIINRWGTTLLQTFLKQANKNNILTLEWSGKTKAGKACSAGTYYYVVSYVTPQGKTKDVKGYVTLLR